MFNSILTTLLTCVALASAAPATNNLNPTTHTVRFDPPQFGVLVVLLCPPQTNRVILVPCVVGHGWSWRTHQISTRVHCESTSTFCHTLGPDGLLDLPIGRPGW